VKLGLPARTRGFSPVPFGRVQPLLAALAALTFWAPGRCTASTAIVPDGYPTIQLGIDSGADTILVRAGTYAESPTMSAAPNRSRIVLLADPAASPRPTMQGLAVSILDHNTGDLNVVGLRVVDRVTVQTHSTIASYRFEGCLFEDGLGHGGLPPAFDHAGGLTLLRCLIRGAIDMTVGGLTMESDTVEAGGMTFYASNAIRVSNCWFRNSPIGLQAFIRTGGASVDVVGSEFENCVIGLRVDDDAGIASILVQNNRFRNCHDWGVRVERAEEVDVFENSVRRCGVGIATYGTGPTRVIGNTVTEGTSDGSEILGCREDLDIQYNAVLRCSGSGIRFQDCSAVRITANTSALNQGAGFDLTLYNGAQQTFTYDVSRNIGHGNGGPGLQWTVTGPGAPTFGCNDWFANTGGATSGIAPGATDLAVDPLFCDLANDDVRLRSDSPLLGGACGQIGARGVGCDGSTEVLVALFAAEASDEGVRIRWRLGGDEAPLSVWIERSAAELGPWLRVATERSMDGSVATDWDRAAEPGRRYWYRLAWTTADGRTTYSSPIVIDLASPATSLALRVIGPNPASGPVAIEYVLPRATVIDLSVHDVLGREVARLASGAQSQGLHVAQWTGNVGRRRAPPGLYFVRLRSSDGQQSRRILLRQ
jgi:parallel beta helix pectate lyase-like protein